MTYTLRIAETSYGHATFSSKEEADNWIEAGPDRDWSLIEWTDSEPLVITPEA
tara:strand:- start:168 stop:326 length:159 start_codon:yes stop_codon:yes gene_type:complete